MSTRFLSVLGVLIGATATLGCSGKSPSADPEPGDAGADAGACEARAHGALRFSTDLEHDGGYPTPQWTRVGVVTAAASNEFTLDTCPPGGGCSPDEMTVVLTEEGAAPLLDVLIPVGAFVEVRALEEHFAFGATQYSLTMQNQPVWEGLANPVAADSRWYLVLSEGERSVTAAPFTVSTTDVECGEHTVDYAFQEPGGLPIAIPDGAVTQVELAGQTWDVDIVRSASPWCCDFPSPYAWWAALAQ